MVKPAPCATVNCRCAGPAQSGDLLVFPAIPVSSRRGCLVRRPAAATGGAGGAHPGQHSVLAHVRSSKSPKPGTRLILDSGPDGEKVEAEMRVRHDAPVRDPFPGSAPRADHSGSHRPLCRCPHIDRPDGDADRSATRPSTTRSRVPWRRPRACTSTSRCSRRSAPRGGAGLRDPARGGGHLPAGAGGRLKDHHMLGIRRGAPGGGGRHRGDPCAPATA